MANSLPPSCLAYSITCLLTQKMGTRFVLFSPPPPTQTHQIFHSATTLSPFSKTLNKRKIPGRIHSSNTRKFGNFLDLKPEQGPEFLDFDYLPWLQPHDRSRLDVLIIGTGPAGLRLAEQVSSYGIKVYCIDPNPLSMWPNNYGVWVDEFESLGLENCLDKTWPVAVVYINDLKHPYGRFCRKKLINKLIEGCIVNGVRFYNSKVWQIEHKEFESSILCDDGNELKGSLIVDASGFASTFTEYDKSRDHGYQIAHGILAEVNGHPFDSDKVLLMYCRDSHLGNEPYLRVSNSKFPTFLYACNAIYF